VCCQFGIFVSKREARGMIKTGTAEGVGLKAEVGFGRTEDWTANEKVDQHTRSACDLEICGLIIGAMLVGQLEGIYDRQLSS